MQKLQFPESLENQEDQNQMNQMTEDTVIDSVFFLQSLVREVERRERINGTSADVMSFNYDIKIPREDVYLTREDGMKVNDVDGLTLILNEVQEVRLAENYTGRGADKLVVFELKIPAGWHANVGAIRLTDLPEKALRDTDPWVHPIRLKKPGGYSTIRHISSKLRPFRSDRNLFEIPKEEVNQKYGWFTVKVNKSDLTLRHWFPGIDIHTGAGPEHFVLLGYKPYRPERSEKQASQVKPSPEKPRLTFAQLRK